MKRLAAASRFHAVRYDKLKREYRGLDLADFILFSQLNNGLMSPQVAAVVLEVSDTRVLYLMSHWRFTRFWFSGYPFLSVKEVLAFRSSDRRPGRPRKNQNSEARPAGRGAKTKAGAKGKKS